MKRLLLRIVLAWMLAFGGMIGSAQAQDMPQQRNLPGPQTTGFQPISQTSTVQSCSCGGRGDTQDCDGRRPSCDSFNRGVSGCVDHFIAGLNRYGMGCMATHNTHGCTGTYAQYLFIFGSCREFFGDPCQPPPYSCQACGRLATLCGK